VRRRWAFDGLGIARSVTAADTLRVSTGKSSTLTTGSIVGGYCLIDGTIAVER
jgi:hypothetical protein